jgi:hypothetical protein
MAPEVRIELLLALVPPPRRRLVTYHGLLGPAAGLRSRVVPQVAGDEAVAAAVDVDRVVDLLEELERLDELTGQIAMLKVLESRPDETSPGGYSLRLVEKRWSFGKA